MVRKHAAVIEDLFEAGSGSEATVKVQLRTEFPGIGGTLITNEGAITALRIDYNTAPKVGHQTFLKHMIIKKLEDFFYRTHVYKWAHIPRPLGSISKRRKGPFEAYLYEFAFGVEGFPWECADYNEPGGKRFTTLKDWNAFVGSFSSAGINVGYDVADVDDGRMSKNIIYQAPMQSSLQDELTSIWKRIDFGPRSLPINYDVLSAFLHDHRRELVKVLRLERFEMIQLAAAYLANNQGISERDIGRLEALVGDYRRSTLIHHTSRGSGLTETQAYLIGSNVQSLT